MGTGVFVGVAVGAGVAVGVAVGTGVAVGSRVSVGVSSVQATTTTTDIASRTRRGRSRAGGWRSGAAFIRAPQTPDGYATRAVSSVEGLNPLILATLELMQFPHFHR